ncbi:MAG: pyridoxamine 5'-phosphate oxidase family protein, partial [Candidatus Hodarchaeales archaeon]
MKLGDMQPVKPYVFLQEQIFQGIWPFNQLRSPLNVFLLTLLYLFWGMGLYFLYNIPLYFLIAGIFAAISISLWTLGIFSYANKIRGVKIEQINLTNKKFLVQYLEDLFHPSSIVFGVVLTAFSYVFLLSTTELGTSSILLIVQEELGTSSLPPLLLLYVFLITFDICYRLGLSSYVMITQLRRNLRLSRYLDDKNLKQHFSPFDIRELERADLYHYLALLAGLFLLPLVYFDFFLFFGLVIYLIISFLVASVNILHLRSLNAKAIPIKIKNLLNGSHLAYVGTLSDNNQPHVTPILYVFDGNHIFLATSIGSKKIKNLRKN